MDVEERSVVEAAVRAFKDGRMVMVMDRLDRENECDFIISAHGCTKKDMSFMIRHSTGIVCIVTDKERLDAFGLHVATPNNTDSNGTNFHVATDYIPTTTTGVSAQDRVNTLKAFSDISNKPEDFSKPGHMFPLCAKPNGLIERDGHTESAYDLCRLAGLETVAAIAEMMTDEGDMMRLDECKAFAKEHGIPLISTVMLKEYAVKCSDIYINAPTTPQAAAKPDIKLLSSCRVPLHHVRSTTHCDLRVYRGCSDPSLEIVTLIKGDVYGRSHVPVRVHSECFTGDVLRSMKCDCGDQLLDFLVTIDEEARGVLLYIRGHEGRGIGLANKIKAYNLQDRKGLDTVESNLKLGYAPDCRDFTDARRALRHLGIKSVVLYTNNPAKVAALGDLVEEVKAVPARPNENNIDYLRTKQVKFNHLTVLRSSSSFSHRSDQSSGELSPVTTAALSMEDTPFRPPSAICLVIPPKARGATNGKADPSVIPSLHCTRCGIPVTGDPLPLGAYTKFAVDSTCQTPSASPSVASVIPSLPSSPPFEPDHHHQPCVDVASSSNTLRLPDSVAAAAGLAPIMVIPNGIGVKSEVISLRRCNLEPAVRRAPWGGVLPPRKGIIEGFTMSNAVCSKCNAINGWYLKRLRTFKHFYTFDRWTTVLPGNQAPPLRRRRRTNEIEQFNRLGSLPLYTKEVLATPREAASRVDLEACRPEGYWGDSFSIEDKPVERIDCKMFTVGKEWKKGQLRTEQKKNAKETEKRMREAELAWAATTDKESYAQSTFVKEKPASGVVSDSGIATAALMEHQQQRKNSHHQQQQQQGAASAANTGRRRPSRTLMKTERSNTLTEEMFDKIEAEERSRATANKDAAEGKPRRFSRQFSIPREYMTPRGVVESGGASGHSSHRSSRRNSRSDSASSSRKNSDAIPMPGSRKGSRASAGSNILPSIGESRKHSLKSVDKDALADVVNNAVLHRKALKSIAHVMAGRRHTTGSTGNRTLSGAINTALPSDLTALAPSPNNRAAHILHSPAAASRGSISAAGAARIIGAGVGTKLMGSGGQPRPSALDSILGEKMEERRKSLVQAAAAILGERGAPASTEGLLASPANRRWSSALEKLAGNKDAE